MSVFETVTEFQSPSRAVSGSRVVPVDINQHIGDIWCSLVNFEQVIARRQNLSGYDQSIVEEIDESPTRQDDSDAPRPIIFHGNRTEHIDRGVSDGFLDIEGTLR